MKDVVFVSVAFGEQYIAQQERLKESILSFYPDANFLFYTGEYPEGSPSYYDSMYGFKPYAIEVAREHFNKVIWLDTAMILTDKIDSILDLEIVVTKDDNKLYKFISDRCLIYFGLTRSQVVESGWHLAGGSFYYFNFTSEKTRKIFEEWQKAEKDGIFGSQYEEASEKLQGHRHDETCIAVCTYRNGLEPISIDKVRYCIENNPMLVKRHFK